MDQLIDNHTMAVLPAASGRDKRSAAASRGGLFCAMGMVPSAYRGLLVDFQDVLNPAGDLPPPTHEVEHHLITARRPVSASFRRLDPEKHEAACAAFAKLEKQGIICQSNSCWASPLDMAILGSSTSSQSRTSTPPLPRIDDLAGRLKGCNIFTKLDLKQRYHQIPMASADTKKTAIMRPIGLFMRMPFGLQNVASPSRANLRRQGRENPRGEYEKNAPILPLQFSQSCQSF